VPTEARQVISVSRGTQSEIEPAEKREAVGQRPAPVTILVLHAPESHQFLATVREPVAVWRQFANLKTPLDEVVLVPVAREAGAKVIRREMNKGCERSSQNQDAAGFKQALELIQDMRWLRDMLEHFAA